MKFHHIVLAAVAIASFALKAQLMEDPALAERVDTCVERGLAYLAGIQKDDGSMPGDYGDTAALPALAGMAFLSKGYLPGHEPYGKVINKSIDFVLSKAEMSPKARFKGYMGGGNGKMYAHAIATLFLSEVSGMVDDERQKKIDKVLPYAVQIILDAQNRKKHNPAEDGGWRYTPDAGDSDLSCSGWSLMALRSSRLNGAHVPPQAIDKAVRYIKRCRDEADGAFYYRTSQKEYKYTMSGAAILCLELCGKHADPYSMAAAKFLSAGFDKEYSKPWSAGRVAYGLYYASQGLFQIGGEHWKNFSDYMYRKRLPLQRPDGSFMYNSSEERNPAYATSMTILAFTVPYRQLPIYQRDETVDE